MSCIPFSSAAFRTSSTPSSWTKMPKNPLPDAAFFSRTVPGEPATTKPVSTLPRAAVAAERGVVRERGLEPVLAVREGRVAGQHVARRLDDPDAGRAVVRRVVRGERDRTARRAGDWEI
jgi:hypothetical protein